MPQNDIATYSAEQHKARILFLGHCKIAPLSTTQSNILPVLSMKITPSRGDKYWKSLIQGCTLLLQEDLVDWMLPDEIWQKIASHMSIKDWAKASGMCKTTWILQLHSVKVTGSQSLGVPGKGFQLHQFFPHLVYFNAFLLSWESCIPRLSFPVAYQRKVGHLNGTLH